MSIRKKEYMYIYLYSDYSDSYIYISVVLSFNNYHKCAHSENMNNIPMIQCNQGL